MKFALLVAAVSGLVSAEHVLHETRESNTRGSWIQTERVQPDAVVPLRIALKQNNLEAGQDRLLAISHPESEHYAKHMSAKEVHDFFAPSNAAIDQVHEWLVSSGIQESSIAHYESRGWLAIDLPAHDVEKLFMTKMHEYEDKTTGNLRVGCESYHVPSHLVDHIDFIMPGVKLSPNLRKRSVKRHDKQHDRDHKWKGHKGGKPYQPHPPPHKPEPMPPAAHDLPPELQNCSNQVTPACQRALYGLPMLKINDSVNTVGIFEQGDFFAQSDLSSFFSAFAPNVPPATSPTVLSINGAEAPVPADDPGNGGGSTLDISIIQSLVYPQSVVVYQVDIPGPAMDGLELFTTFNTFLDALDGSYCNYTAFGISGDSPGIDPTYPDPAADGYKGQRQCGVYKPTRVINVGYGQSEAAFPKNYLQRQCNEFMKLGLQGHTILIASGGFGVASGPGDPSDSGCLSGNGQNETIYNPIYPGGCPWVTVVGATQINPNQTVRDPEVGWQQNRSAPDRPPAFQFSASSGGFSNDFTAPSYQKSTLNSYFGKYDPGLPFYVANANASNLGEKGGVYNRAGRAMPDVSANGFRVPGFINGTVVPQQGTQVATPVWSAVVTLINQERTKAGKGPVGFINTALYANPWMLNDIVSGSNPNCGSSGFEAQPGWDPVTGLGTPNYPKLIKYFLSCQ